MKNSKCISCGSKERITTEDGVTIAYCPKCNSARILSTFPGGMLVCS